MDAEGFASYAWLLKGLTRSIPGRLDLASKAADIGEGRDVGRQWRRLLGDSA